MSKQPIYGFPCVSDPNDFIPDGESCSPAELEAHRLAVANFGKPSYEPNKGCYTEHDADGRLVKHVLRTSWGIGTNLIDSCDGCRNPHFDGDPAFIPVTSAAVLSSARRVGRNTKRCTRGKIDDGGRPSGASGNERDRC